LLLAAAVPVLEDDGAGRQAVAGRKGLRRNRAGQARSLPAGPARRWRAEI